jgi:peptidoglycan/LPS O-acetylase OafA/YrhL
MELLSHWIFPKGQNNTPRFYSALGLWCITIALQFSDPLKNILSNKYLLFAGKVSFAVYLLHGTLLRTLLVWVLFGFSVPPDIIGKDGKVTKPPLLKLPNRFLFWFWIVVWLIVQYYLANLWMNTVDPWCARLTEKLEKYVFKETTKPEASPVATRPVEMQGVTTVVESRPLMEGILPT